MNATIRIATAEDRKDWERLRSQLWPECPLERHRLEIEQLLAGSGVVALATVGKELVGFVEVSVRVDHVEGTTSAPVAYLEGWYMAEKYRGQGTGRALLAFAENWAVDQGYRELASDAEIANAGSIRLHKIAGFREVGRSVHFVKSLAKRRIRI
jgi:aminoglycoside 6'-N-acetyltransferase I